MTFTVELNAHRGDTRRVVLAGRLDSTTADELEQAVQDLIANPPGLRRVRHGVARVPEQRRACG